MNIIVFGGRGLMGSHLVPRLREQGHNVVVTDIVAGSEAGYRTCDVTREGDVRRLFDLHQTTDAVFNLAACCGRVVAEENQALALAVNVLGAHHVATVCHEWGLPLVHVSTSEVYGVEEEREDGPMAPQNFYGLTKAQGHQLVMYTCPSARIAVPFMAYSEYETPGPHRSFMIRAAAAMHRQEPITIHRGSARSWLHMQDAVDWLIAMQDDRFAGQVLNLGHPDAPIPNEDVVARMEAVWGRPARIVYADMPARIRAVKRPTLARQQALLPPPKVSLTQGLIRLYRFMEGV